MLAMSSSDAMVPLADVASSEAAPVDPADNSLAVAASLGAGDATAAGMGGAGVAAFRWPADGRFVDGAASVDGACLEAASAVASDENFYASLAEISEFRDVIDPDRHALAPHDSLVVITDVVGSTKAIEAGRYKDVNALGVASIIALCNAMRDLDLPYVFGGDGATLLVPGTRRAAAEKALRGVRTLAASAFGMGLRASIVPLVDLMAAGHVARVARFRASEFTRLAMFSGGAFSTAESWVKDAERGPRYVVPVEGESAADFDGFECRWQPTGSQRGHTVSLIVRALAPTEAARTQTYKNLLHAFDRIVDSEACHPVKLNELTLSGWLGDFSVEARVRAQGASGPTYAAARRSARKQTFVGRLLTASGMAAGGFDGKLYKRELISNCDFRKFDDTLRMVVDLNVAEIYRLESRLSAEQRAGRLAYGMHRSSAALITCLVRSYTGDHVHFVDGADGGYALAAKELKGQLEELATRGTQTLNGTRTRSPR
jgi:hypothetical protein